LGITKVNKVFNQLADKWYKPEQNHNKQSKIITQRRRDAKETQSKTAPFFAYLCAFAALREFFKSF